jgi:hypothetical protein
MRLKHLLAVQMARGGLPGPGIAEKKKDQARQKALPGGAYTFFRHLRRRLQYVLR